MRPTRFCGPILSTISCGDSRASRSVTERAKLRAQSQSWRRSIGTTTCIPRPPLALRKARNPSSSSSARVSSVASTMLAQGSAGSGSRSKITRSGRSMRSLRAFQVWNSTLPICTASMTAVMLSAWINRACSGSSFFGSARMCGIFNRPQ